MTNDCICSNVPRIWRLAGVTRTVRLTVTKDGSPYDFTGLQTVLRIDRDNSDFHYEPQFTVEGDDNNIIVFTWAADKQPLGDYTIEVTVTDGSGNKDRVNWHGATGVRLVEYSNLVKGEDAAGVESDSELGLDGIFTMNGVGMDAYEEWLADGNEGSLHDYILWMQGPAREAAEVAEAQMAVIQSRADDDHTTAESDHTRAGSDHTTATGDHTRAEEDHQFAFENRVLAYEDHLRAEDDHTTAAADHTAAQADHATAGSDHTRAEADHATAASDHSTAASDHTKAGQDSTRAGSDHDIAVADHAQAEADHTRAEGDHTTAAADHTTAAADHTQAASDHTTAAADHTQAVADHAVMAGYDTRLTNVETDVTQLGQEVDDENKYLGNLHQGYIDDGVWKDLTTGNRYYAIFELEGFDGEAVYAKAPVSYASIIYFLSAYNPVENGSADVLGSMSISANQSDTSTVPVGTKYIYVLSKTGDPANDRIPVEFTIGELNVLATAKENLISLRKESFEKFATKTELNKKPDIKDTYLKRDIVVASGSKSVTGKGDIATVNIVANGGDTIKITMSGKDTVWGSARVYPILNGVEGSPIIITASESLIEVPEGGITQLRINLGTGMFIASGTVNYSASFKGVKDKFDKYDQLYDKLNPISDAIALRSDLLYKSGSKTITSSSSTNFLSDESAGLKKGDQIKITISGIGTVISSYRVYFVSTTSTTYTVSPNLLTVPFDTDYLKIGIGSGVLIESGTVQWSVEKIGVNTRIDDLQNKIDGKSIIERNKDIDDVIYASGWNNIGSTKVQEKLFQLLISGDIHGDGTRMQSIITYFNSKSFINAGIMLGDLVGSNYTSDFSFYVPAIQNVNKPFITIAGNHDMGSEEDHTLNAPSMEAFYNRYYAPTLQYAGTIVHTSGKCYFYKDFADDKIRMIMLNQYDYPDTDLSVDGYQKGLIMYSQEQIDWLISTLSSTPSDYAVIIAFHSAPGRMVPVNCDFTGRDFRSIDHFAPGTTINGDIIGDIINAWINGDSLIQTYSITVTSALSSLSVSADFSLRGEGEFVCYLGGHWHNYIISHDSTHTGQLQINVNNAKCIARESDMPRLEGSKSEDAFAILSVDRTNKKVKIATVGARVANDLVVREIYSIEY